MHSHDRDVLNVRSCLSSERLRVCKRAQPVLDDCARFRWPTARGLGVWVGQVICQWRDTGTVPDG
jgi:hypothetical protein